MPLQGKLALSGDSTSHQVVVVPGVRLRLRVAQHVHVQPRVVHQGKFAPPLSAVLVDLIPNKLLNEEGAVSPESPTMASVDSGTRFG